MVSPNAKCNLQPATIPWTCHTWPCNSCHCMCNLKNHMKKSWTQNKIKQKNTKSEQQWEKTKGTEQQNNLATHICFRYANSHPWDTLDTANGSWAGSWLAVLPYPYTEISLVQCALCSVQCGKFAMRNAGETSPRSSSCLTLRSLATAGSIPVSQYLSISASQRQSESAVVRVCTTYGKCGMEMENVDAMMFFQAKTRRHSRIRFRLLRKSSATLIVEPFK